MKKMYWTAYNVHPYLMAALCIISLLCMYIVEHNKSKVPVKHHDLKLAATLKSVEAFEALKKARKQKGLSVDLRFDPSNSGLIGMKQTPITSDHGVLRSKQISLNPNLAALFVEWLEDLKLKPGEVVAIGMTGSFPALDVSILSAVHAMKLKPLIIVSATASQWGANIPYFSWLDMYNALYQDKIFPYEVVAASIGASKDKGNNLSSKGLNIVLNTIKKYDIPLIHEARVSESINKRLAIYKQYADGKPIKAYINIGGGVASIGKHFAHKTITAEQKREIFKHNLKTGPNLTLPVWLANTDSVAIRFLKHGIPVINMRNVNAVADRYNLHPWNPTMGIGRGPLFFTQRYNLWLALISLIIIFVMCWTQVRIQLTQKHVQAGEQNL